MSRRWLLRGTVVAMTLAATACGPSFRVRNYPTPDALFGASLLEFQKKKWDNAVEGFEKVTLELGSRDPLLPSAYLYLGRAYVKRNEFLVAANTFARITESFPEDTLAPQGLFEQGLAYRQLWRKPTLDQQYGVLAQSTFRTMLSAYPESPLRDRALSELKALDEMLASKDFEIGMHYKRRKAPDSAIIYFRDVLAQFPTTDTARRSGLALLEVYRSIKYTEDATELCGKLKSGWPKDGAVELACAAPPPAGPAVGGAKTPAAPPGS